MSTQAHELRQECRVKAFAVWGNIRTTDKDPNRKIATECRAISTKRRTNTRLYDPRPDDEYS